MKEKRFKYLVFDLGGVIMDISYEQALQRFAEIGVEKPERFLDPYHQAGFFGDLEEGLISAEDFRRQLSAAIGRELTLEECAHGWRGYCVGVPPAKLATLRRLREKGYRLFLLSNTNPFMMQWARSDEFDGQGGSLDSYFDALYLSYECRVMKPAREIFEMMLQGEGCRAEEALFIDDSENNCRAAEALGIRTLCPKNNEDWSEALWALLGED